nr:alpha/beta fold hydrolase [Paracidovorax oryzae]
MNAAAATLRAMDDSALARPAAPAALHGTEHEYLLEGHGPLATTGILLIHGLTGTPNEMRLLAKGLHRAGFTVLAVQLAGHCGTQDDLIATRWQDWVASARRGADRLMQLTGQPVVACGLSMGALLALALAIERPRQVAGVVALSTTFRYDGWSMPAYTRLAFLLNRSSGPSASAAAASSWKHRPTASRTRPCASAWCRRCIRATARPPACRATPGGR